MPRGVHARHPVGFRDSLLLLGVFAAVTFDLDDQVKQIVFAAAVIHQHDEIGEVPCVSEP